VYAAAVLGVLHYIWLAKKVLVEPWVYAAVLAVLLAVRGWDAGRRIVKRRRAGLASRTAAA
jgi:sulfoxide reductase heme-binding subunit YedZ